VRRSIEEKPEYAYYLCYAPVEKDTIEALVRLAGEGWKIEQCFQTAKGECGLDHYEVRHRRSVPCFFWIPRCLRRGRSFIAGAVQIRTERIKNEPDGTFFKVEQSRLLKQEHKQRKKLRRMWEMRTVQHYGANAHQFISLASNQATERLQRPHQFLVWPHIGNDRAL
jgi:hypothetical protein